LFSLSEEPSVDTDMSGKGKARWSDEDIVNMDALTIDAEQCIAILRSRGVEVPDGRQPKAQLASLFKKLQRAIVTEASVTAGSEGRKRASSRGKAPTKAAAKEEEPEVTPSRPKRKSGAAAAKKAAVEEKPQPEEVAEPENAEEEEAEPENKKRKSSVKRPLNKRRSSVRPAKRTAKDDEQEEEEEKPQEEEQEQEVQEPPKKQRASPAAPRGKKRAAEAPAEEVAEAAAEEKKDEEEDAKKKPAPKRKPSVAKAKRRKVAEEPPQQEAMEVDEQPAVDAQQQQPAEVQPVVETPSKLKEVISRVRRFSFSLFNKSPAPAPAPAPAPVEQNNTVEVGTAAHLVPPPLSEASEEALPVGTTVPDVAVRETVVVDGEIPAVEKKKGIVVTPKLEIIVMSIGIALLAVFLSLFIGLSMKATPVDECKDILCKAFRDCKVPEPDDEGIEAIMNAVEKFGSKLEGCIPHGGSSSVLRNVGFALLVILLISACCVGIYFLVRFIKRYCDSLTSVDTLKSSCCRILKEQAEASQAQADAVSKLENPPDVMPSHVRVDSLKSQVFAELPAEEQKNLVVRFRMYLALRSLRKMPNIRVGTVGVENDFFETMKWTGRIN